MYMATDSLSLSSTTRMPQCRIHRFAAQPHDEAEFFSLRGGLSVQLGGYLAIEQNPPHSSFRRGEPKKPPKILSYFEHTTHLETAFAPTMPHWTLIKPVPTSCFTRWGICAETPLSNDAGCRMIGDENACVLSRCQDPTIAGLAAALYYGPQ